MSDRPFMVVCEVHGFEARIGVSLPCPWPGCRKVAGAKVHAVRVSEEPRWPSDEALDTVKVGTVIYESRAFAISGDGARSTMYVWVKR